MSWESRGRRWGRKRASTRPWPASVWTASSRPTASNDFFYQGKGKERKGKERKGKERKGKEKDNFSAPLDFDFNAKELCHIHKCQKGESVRGKDLLFAHLLHKWRHTLAGRWLLLDRQSNRKCTNGNTATWAPLSIWMTLSSFYTGLWIYSKFQIKRRVLEWSLAWSFLC